jgi:hypothetical protein
MPIVTEPCTHAECFSAINDPIHGFGIGINPRGIHYRGGSNLTRSFREPPKPVA